MQWEEACGSQDKAASGSGTPQLWGGGREQCEEKRAAGEEMIPRKKRGQVGSEHLESRFPFLALHPGSVAPG